MAPNNVKVLPLRVNLTKFVLRKWGHVCHLAPHLHFFAYPHIVFPKIKVVDAVLFLIYLLYEIDLVDDELAAEI